jgi:hypothetical protein
MQTERDAGRAAMPEPEISQEAARAMLAARVKTAKELDDPHMFVVEGRGEFPFDMLRHSMAHPASSADASRMADCGKRRVALVGATARHITPARWASFGWSIVAGFAHNWPTDISDALAEGGA